MATSFVVNGKPASTDAPTATPLLWVLREELKLTGTKYGCGVGLCGACTVHIDGSPNFACLNPIKKIIGKRHHHRRPVAGFQPSAAEGLARRERAAMRLLPVGTDHARGRPAQGKRRIRRASRSSITCSPISAAAEPIRASCAPSSARRRRASHGQNIG